MAPAPRRRGDPPRSGCLFRQLTTFTNFPKNVLHLTTVKNAATLHRAAICISYQRPSSLTLIGQTYTMFVYSASQFQHTTVLSESHTEACQLCYSNRHTIHRYRSNPTASHCMKIRPKINDHCAVASPDMTICEAYLIFNTVLCT